MIKAIIFDMDGLMVDTETLHYQAFNTVFRGIGRDFSQEDNNRLYIGLSDIDEARDMVKRYNLPLTPEDLVERKRKEYRKLISNAIIPRSGLIELLKKLKSHGYKIAVASSSILELVELIITGLHVNQFVGSYCSAEEVEHGKPAPDIFLLAATRLGVKPANCLVLEDAPKGVQAAKAAGMKVLAIPSEATLDGDFSEANHKLTSLSEVFPYLQNQYPNGTNKPMG